MAKVSYDSLSDRYKSTIANQYVKPPVQVGAYSSFRGVTDFTNIAQFTQYESGYGQLFLLSSPKFMETLAEKNGEIKVISDTFKNILEYEFKGISGLPDLTSDTVSITNGIQEIRMISKINKESAVTVSMSYYERTGLPLTKYAELYLTGIKDPNSEYKLYHGLVANGDMTPGYENEIFKMLYINTDNTGTAVESATLLTNMQLTSAKKSIANMERGNIENQQIDLEFTCYPVTGSRVDYMAQQILAASTGVKVSYDTNTKNIARSVDTSKTEYKGGKSKDQNATIDTYLNSNDYNYVALQEKMNFHNMDVKVKK